MTNLKQMIEHQVRNAPQGRIAIQSILGTIIDYRTVRHVFMIEQIRKAKLPGGTLQGRPSQGDDGKWYDQFGELLPEGAQRDLVYAARFWQQNQPRELRDAMRINIENAYSHGRFTSGVDTKALTEDNKRKLSAYRILADEMGYIIGQYQFHKGSGTVTAPITKKG